VLAPAEIGTTAADAASSTATAAAAPPSASVDPALLPRIQDWTRQLVELERRAQQIEFERAAIPLIGVRIGKYISWTAFALMATQAFGSWARAQSVDEALDEMRSDPAYDVDGDDDVDRDDERRARRVGRGLAISSLVPLGLGIFSTVLERRRRHKVQTLSSDLDDIRNQRRSVLSRLAQDVNISGTQASLELRLRF
jgi:hypothetical protein